MSKHVLSDIFFEDLIDEKNGRLQPLMQAVRNDKDLDFQIRAGYINLYYKGNSLLKLSSSGRGYRAEIHDKFYPEAGEFNFDTPESTQRFVEVIPRIKANIILHGASSLEIEFEQLLIRSNNRELGNNTEYFIVDRQYAVGSERFDLLGFYWDRNNRSKNRKVQPCLIEVKFGLNNDIRDIAEQIDRYHEQINAKSMEIASELSQTFQQKLRLGLYAVTKERKEAMNNLIFLDQPQDFLYILSLIDFNPNSKLLDPKSFEGKPFTDQIRVFSSGLGMWNQVPGYGYSYGVRSI